MTANSTQPVYGRWKQTSPPYKRDGDTVVDVICTCGSGIKATKLLAMLKHRGGGCGCIRRETVIARNRALAVAVPVGSVFGRLTTLDEPVSLGRYRKVRCGCTCGNELVTMVRSLLEGATRSCGCLRSETTAASNLTHGLSGIKMYSVWSSIVERCTSLSCKAYKNYGGRGITIDSKWLKFENFYADMGEPPFDGATIDREDNEKGYCKDNCRWATRAEQASNTRRNKLYSFAGKLAMLKDIAADSNVALGALYYRVNTLKETADAAVKHLTRNKVE